MQRVSSSLAHSIGHDKAGLVVVYHSGGCGSKKAGACDCQGGEKYHYPTVTAEEFAQMMGSKSVGSHFMANIRAKHKGVKA